LGGGSQQIAPEFFWQHAHLTDVQPDQLHAPGHKTPRPDHIYREEEGGQPVPLQFAELATRAVVREVVPGWMTRILCYGFTHQDQNGKVTESFTTPGPTIHAKAGHPLVVRLRNEIDPCLMLDVSMHNHGGHIPAHADGHPNFMVEPQSMTGADAPHPAGVRDYFYPNPVPRKVTQSATSNGQGGWNWKIEDEWDFGEIQNTMWYHDHAEDITAHNALMGLAGYFFLQDAPIPDSQGKDQTGPSGWRDYLPKKQIPLVFKDLCLVPIREQDQIQPAVLEKLRPDQFGEARIHFDPFDHNGTLGNIQVVNGVAYPFQEVKFDSYWLRMLNASLARFYNLEWWAIHPETREAKRLAFLRFGKDSWLFETPLEQSSVFIGMAARADVCIDFSQLKSKTFEEFEKDGRYEVMLVSTLNQRDGRGPGHGDNEVTLSNLPRGAANDTRDDRAAPLFLMKFIVSENANDKATWPTADTVPCQPPGDRADPGLQTAKMAVTTRLRYHHQQSVPKPGEIAVREFNFERGRGAWQINKRFYDSCIANAVPQLWSTELWILRNRSGGWWHPIHIHVESHQHLFVRARNHRGERISLCRTGYNPQLFDAALDDGAEPLNLEKEILAWDQTFNPQVLAETRHNTGVSDFDAAVWNLNIKHDTTVLGPNTEVHLLMRFRTFEGPFVFHCHNLDHEDMRMMYQMDPRECATFADEQLAVRGKYWFFVPPNGKEHCCHETKGEHA
ncbi:MAG: multicopper oxidase domain-containing protein, partial [Planctomycetaceae bacterium]|nr:multicopper oxidase domain-containing protein [Planctomycetaceae bacterium]